ncbi:hypothetical protein C8R46DRAFT_901525 [Mycena filopes]|nr:hypothetical protein C8R46DRAFT_901525 [Mycena filopes]
MYPSQSILFGVLAAFLVGAAPTPDNLLGEVIDALGIGLVTSIQVTLSLETLINNLVSVSFDGDFLYPSRRIVRSRLRSVLAQNPLPFDLTLDRVRLSAGLNGTTYISFDQAVSNFVVPSRGTANSGTIPNVPLTQGIQASLAIIAFEELDLQELDIDVQCVVLGVPLVISGLHQNDVPTTYVCQPLHCLILSILLRYILDLAVETFQTASRKTM